MLLCIVTRAQCAAAWSSEQSVYQSCQRIFAKFHSARERSLLGPSPYAYCRVWQRFFCCTVSLCSSLIAQQKFKVKHQLGQSTRRRSQYGPSQGTVKLREGSLCGVVYTPAPAPGQAVCRVGSGAPRGVQHDPPSVYQSLAHTTATDTISPAD